MGRRGWVAIAIVVIAVLGIGAVLSWYAWRRYTAPTPPVISREGLDPDLAEALETARRKVLADPYSAQNWGELGKLLRSSQLYSEAVACFAQAERLDPANPRWPYSQGETLRIHDNNAALPHLQRAAALAARSDPFAPDLRLAEVLLAVGKNDEAEKTLRRASEIEPDDPTVHYYLGLLALARNDLDNSLAHLKRCEHSPFTQRKASIQLAAVYRRIERTKEADRYSHKADTLPPDRNWLDPFLSDALAIGRPARFQEAARLASRGDYRSAAEQLSVLIQEKPEYNAYVVQAGYLYKLGDLDRAEQALRSAMALTSENFKATLELSKILLTRADKNERANPQRARTEFAEAAACARQALASRSDDAMAHVVLGMALRRLGKRPEALHAFRTAVQCNPNLTDAHFYLGETLADSGQFAEARASLERARELSPDDPRPPTALAKLKKP